MKSSQQQRIFEIARHFGLEVAEVSSISAGLINHSYRLRARDGGSFFLQSINTRVFPKPLSLQKNYVKINEAVSAKYPIPNILSTRENQLLWEDHGGVWRCFSFIENSYSPQVLATEEMAFTLAYCFGTYTSLLSKASRALDIILPRFHDLGWRNEQLMAAINNCKTDRLEQSQLLIDSWKKYDWLLNMYQSWAARPEKYPGKIMHHDCKISNILFDKTSGQVICPVDLDTTQPGLFFSDLGDMIRTVAPSEDENFVDTDKIVVRKNFLEALLDGYLQATAGLWTEAEKEALPFSGHILTYMQAMRFLTDYLNDDQYYQVNYPDQNLDRAKNQFKLLELLNEWSAPCKPV